MLPTSITYFKIEIGDLFDFETAKFLAGERSDTEMQMFLSAVEDVIFKEYLKDRIFPFANSGEPSDYYYDQIESLLLAPNIRDKTRLGYFKKYHNEKDLLFEYNQYFEFLPGTEDYHYWFFLKIRQFQSDLSNLPTFLNYHLIERFRSRTEFQKFLKLVAGNYAQVLIYNLINVIDEFVDSLHEIHTKRNLEPTNTELRLKLRIINKDPEFFSSGVRTNELLTIFISLKKEFLHESTSFESFKWFLGLNTIDHQPLIWKRSYFLLRRFIEIMTEAGIIANLKRRDINTWKLAMLYFIPEKNGKIERFQRYENISQASGKDSLETEKLKTLVSKLKCLCT